MTYDSCGLTFFPLQLYAKAARLCRTGGPGKTTWFIPQTKWQSCRGVPTSILRYYDKEELQHTLSMVEYKCWYHETAQTTGTIDPPKNMPDAKIPPQFCAIRRELGIIPQK